MKNYSKIIVYDSQNCSLHEESIEIPELKKGEILVKNEFVTLCRSDINTYIGKRKEKNPTILGHEIVGRIVDMDSDTPDKDELNLPLSIGDRITWGIYSSNPDSHYSKIGIPQKAEGLFKYGHEKHTETNTLHGGLSEYIILRENTPIVKLSEDIPPKVAAVINCAVATVAGALRTAGNIENKKVLVSGAGMLGIIACAMTKYLKASKVFAVDINNDRLQTARKFGADAVFGPLQLTDEDFISAFEKPEVILEFSGYPDAMENLLSFLDIGGIVVWIGATYPQRDLNIKAEKLIRNLHTIKGLHNYNGNDLIRAVDFIENNVNVYPFENLIEDKFAFSEVEKAFEYAVSENPFRVGIKISE